MWEEQHVLNSSKIKELWGHKVPPVMRHDFDLFLLAVQHFINCKNIWSAENHESKYTGSCTHTVFWVREVIIIGVLLETPLEYYWRPHGRLVEDPKIIVGDPHIFIGDPHIFNEDPRFLLETPDVRCRPPDYCWRPNIFIGDPTFSLDLQYFHGRPPDSRWRPSYFRRWPQIFVRDPPDYHGNPYFLLKIQDSRWRSHCFHGRPHIFVRDPIFSLETLWFSLETPRFS